MNPTIILYLLKHANDFVHAKRPVDRREAKALLLGNAEILYALGWAMTPFAIEIAAIDAVRDDPFPAASPNNAARKAWSDEKFAVVAATLGIDCDAV